MNSTKQRGTFVDPELFRGKPMTGHLEQSEHSESGVVFVPDEEYHAALFSKYGIEALEGLFLDGGKFVPEK